MPQIFHPSMNTLSRASIFGAVFFLALAIWIGLTVVRSPYLTGAGVTVSQPVPFSHEHHVADCGIDCRYCHTSVETSSFAGIPSTKICMNCHEYLWTEAPILEPVRESFRSGEPILWTRVHDLPDFAYFDHSIHVHKGIACVVCHGRVDRMPLMFRDKSLLMEWCLDCHFNPERYVRPREFVFDMEWTPDVEMPPHEPVRGEQPYAEDAQPGGLEPLPQPRAAELVEMYNIQKKTDCSVCHR